MGTTVVTGGSGLAGSAVVDELRAEGDDVLNADLRISNILGPEAYAALPQHHADAAFRARNPWGYGDPRDVGLACRLALEVPLTGAETFVIAAADSAMPQPTRELLARHYPDVPIRRELGEHESLLSIEQARRVLGFEPRISWRDVLGDQAG